jgi:hypothetical protein
MPEYRGYVNPADVKAAPTFDWNAVIGDVQKSLTDSEAARQANRDKLEKDTNDTLTAMSKITLGKDEAINQKLTEAAYNYKNAVGNYAKMVREGKAAQKDFNLFNQNAKDTFNQIDAVGKNAKAAYDTYVAESKAGNLSAASDYMAQTLGLAASLKDKTIVMDKNGRGFIAGKDPNDLVEVNWLNNERNLLVPKVKLDVELDAQADKIKDFTKYGSVGADGIWIINDPTVRSGFNEFENNVANGITSDPLRALSVLVDYGDLKGKRFTPTINKEEAAKDPSKIYVQLNASGNPEPVLTPEQDKIAKDTAKRYLRERLTYEQKRVSDTYRPPVFAPEKKITGKEKLEEPSIGAIPSNIVVKGKDGKSKIVGNVVGVNNVRIKTATGVDQTINNFGIDQNGEFFMKYTEYSGKSGIKDSGYSESNVKKRTKTLYGDKEGSEIEGKIVLVPNPDTGENFKSVKEARDYIKRNKTGGKPKLNY